MGAAASVAAGKKPRAGLRERDDGSFVLEVTKSNLRFLVAVKDAEVRGGQLAKIVGEETGAHIGTYHDAAMLFTELALNLRREALEQSGAGALRRPMAFVERGGSYLIPPSVTGVASGMQMLFTGGEVLDPLLDRSPELVEHVVFRRDSCPTGPDGEPIVRPFMMHLSLPAGLDRATRLACGLARAQACVDALALAFAHILTAAVVKFLSAVARVLLRAQLIELFGGAAIVVVASPFRACYKSVYLSLLLSAAGAGSVEHVVSGTETTLPIAVASAGAAGAGVPSSAGAPSSAGRLPLAKYARIRRALRASRAGLLRVAALAAVGSASPGGCASAPPLFGPRAAAGRAQDLSEPADLAVGERLGRIPDGRTREERNSDGQLSDRGAQRSKSGRT